MYPKGSNEGPSTSAVVNDQSKDMEVLLVILTLKSVKPCIPASVLLLIASITSSPVFGSPEITGFSVSLTVTVKLEVDTLL